MELSTSKVAESVTNLYRRCVIVRFGISKWDGKKSCDEEKTKIADTRGLLMKVNLFQNDERFKAITRVDSDARSFVNKHTNVWSHGEKLLSMKRFDFFVSKMNQFEDLYTNAWSKFLEEDNYEKSVLSSIDYWKQHSRDGLIFVMIIYKCLMAISKYKLPMMCWWIYKRNKPSC